MTDSMMHLRALVEKAPDKDILRDMISFAAGPLRALMMCLHRRTVMTRNLSNKTWISQFPLAGHYLHFSFYPGRHPASHAKCVRRSLPRPNLDAAADSFDSHVMISILIKLPIEKMRGV